MRWFCQRWRKHRDLRDHVHQQLRSSVAADNYDYFVAHYDYFVAHYDYFVAHYDYFVAHYDYFVAHYDYFVAVWNRRYDRFWVWRNSRDRCINRLWRRNRDQCNRGDTRRGSPDRDGRDIPIQRCRLGGVGCPGAIGSGPSNGLGHPPTPGCPSSGAN